MSCRPTRLIVHIVSVGFDRRKSYCVPHRATVLARDLAQSDPTCVHSTRGSETSQSSEFEEERAEAMAKARTGQAARGGGLMGAAAVRVRVFGFRMGRP
jgi:hypothetical protein